MSKADKYREAAEVANQLKPTSLKIISKCGLGSLNAWVDPAGDLRISSREIFEISSENVPALIAWLKENYCD